MNGLRLLLTASFGLTFALLGGAACSPAAPMPITPRATASIATATPTPAATTSSPAAPPSTRPTRAELARLVCGDRTPCELQRERDAGRDLQGRTLRVLRVHAGIERLDGASPPPRAADAGAVPLGMEETEKADTLSPVAGMGACQRFEYWLVVHDDKAPPSVTKLLSACNNGHGASGVGEDTITVGDNRLDHATSGGSNWRWDHAEVLSLSPLRVRSTQTSGSFTMGNNVDEATWSWDDFSGRHTWWSPPCGPNGTPEESSDPLAEVPPDAFAYLPIPAVDLEVAYRTSGWKTTALGACSARVDASGKDGFVIHGKPGEAGDASMRVLASTQDELFVEVQDDTWVGPSARWVRDDHLELWLSRELPGYMDHCLSSKDAEVPRQWGIRVADGKVFAAAGKPDPKAIGVETSRGEGGAARFKLTLPRGFAAITLVYSDSDDGKTQKRLIATSALRAGKVATLGKILPVDARRAGCGTTAGKLEPRLLAHRGEKAILGDE